MGFNIKRRGKLEPLSGLSAAQLYGIQQADSVHTPPVIQIDTILKHVVVPELEKANRRLKEI